MSDLNPIAQKIKEGILESMDQSGYSIPTRAVKEIAHRKAKELPQPVQSPSDLIVEVDGENRGTLSYYDDNDGYLMLLTPLKEVAFYFKEHHIRLLTKEGGCVMDNRKDQEQ